MKVCCKRTVKFGDFSILKTYKPFFILAVLVLLTVIIVAMLSTAWPKQEKYFFELGLLGQNMTADAYFANANSAVDVGATNSWFIYVNNHMGTKQNVLVRAKLLDMTMELPDDREHQSSYVPSFAEFPLSLSINETVLVPFFWSIPEVEEQEGLTVVKRLLVNEQSAYITASTLVNSTLRIVFELWVQNRDTGEYMFGWESEEGLRSVSIYKGFKLNLNS